MLEERFVYFRPRAILTTLLVVLAVAAALEVIWISRHVITWIVVAVFLTLALNPAVESAVGARNQETGYAVAITMVGAILVIAAIGAVFVPTLVHRGEPTRRRDRRATSTT